MDTIDFNWLNDDNDIMDSLVGLAGLSEEHPSQATNDSAGTDILQYLLQPNNSSFASSNQTNNQVENTPAPATASATISAASTATPTSNPNDIITDPYLKSTVSVVQAKDNFVTFMPVSTPTTKKQNGAKKTKFKEPIFVTESPQSYSKKKKKSGTNINAHSSGDDNSDDDMLLDEELLASSNTSALKLKQMTSKERRQLRNKISARNFRVRRKGNLMVFVLFERYI
jgi:hypothetical protein